MAHIISRIIDSVQRWRHTLGYGVQSPMAYGLCRDVIYQYLPYYAYNELAALRSETCHATQAEAGDKLLFRLANYLQPDFLALPRWWKLTRNYAVKGCSSAEVMDYARFADRSPIFMKGLALAVVPSAFDLMDAGQESVAVYGDGSMVYIADIDSDRDVAAAWREAMGWPCLTVTFDLQHAAIALVNGKYCKQHYTLRYPSAKTKQ